MKKIVKTISLTLLVMFTLTVNAKSQGGVYLTASDFVNKKVSYETDSKIHLNNSVLTLSHITVIDQGKKLKLSKSEVYGYTDQDKKTYRFYKNEEFLIAEAGNIYIYTQVAHIAQSKGYKVKVNYYFSTSTDAQIMPLTVGNLINAYKTNNKFLDLIDQFFSNGDVTAYDTIHGTYKANYVFAKTLK